MKNICILFIFGLFMCSPTFASSPPTMDNIVHSDLITPTNDLITPQADLIAPQADLIAPQADLIAPQLQTYDACVISSYANTDSETTFNITAGKLFCPMSYQFKIENDQGRYAKNFIKHKENLKTIILVKRLAEPPILLE